MQFSVREFLAEVGATVEIDFNNIGKLPKITMGIVWSFLKKEFQPSLSEGRRLTQEPMQLIFYRIRLRTTFLHILNYLVLVRKRSLNSMHHRNLGLISFHVPSPVTTLSCGEFDSLEFDRMYSFRIS